LVGVVGQLQLDVLRVRLSDEYGLEVNWDTPELALARWITANEAKTLEKFASAHRSAIAEDLDGDPVFLARNAFNLDYTGQQSPGIVFSNIKDVQEQKRKARAAGAG
jgi:peptide chain release factor 3